MNPVDIAVVPVGLAPAGIFAPVHHRAPARARRDPAPVWSTRPADARASESPESEPAGANGQDELTEDREMAERKAEIGDLAVRMSVGAVLTAPVLFAAMAGSFWPGWILANHWLLLALTTPVM